MSITVTGKYDKVILGVNVVLGDKTVGFMEGWDFERLTNKAARYERGLVLASLRAAMFPGNCTIVKAINTVVGLDNVTNRVINNPLAGKFPLASEVTAMATANMTLGASSNGTTMTKAATETAPSEIKVADPDIAPLFRLEGEGDSRSMRHFNAIPDGYQTAGVADGLDPTYVWYDVGGVTQVSTALPAVEKNYWANYKAFFNFLLANAVIVRSHELTGSETRTADNTYDLCPIDSVFYERMSRKKCGQQLFGRRGKARIAS